MFLCTTQLNEDSYQTYCNGCLTPTDVVDSKFLRWCLERDQPIFCMECDSHEADSIAVALRSPQPDEILIVGNVAIVPSERSALGFEVRVVASYPPNGDWESERACLVSHISEISRDKRHEIQSKISEVNCG